MKLQDMPIDDLLKLYEKMILQTEYEEFANLPERAEVKRRLEQGQKAMTCIKLIKEFKA